MFIEIWKTNVIVKPEKWVFINTFTFQILIDFHNAQKHYIFSKNLKLITSIIKVINN